jgi:hypothetical protein
MFLFYSTVPIILKVLQDCWSLLSYWWSWLIVCIFSFFFLTLHLHSHSLVCCRYVAQPCWTSRSWLQTCGLFWSASSLIMRRFVHCTAFLCIFRIPSFLLGELDTSTLLRNMLKLELKKTQLVRFQAILELTKMYSPSVCLHMARSTGSTSLLSLPRRVASSCTHTSMPRFTIISAMAATWDAYTYGFYYYWD